MTCDVAAEVLGHCVLIQPRHHVLAVAGVRQFPVATNSSCCHHRRREGPDCVYSNWLALVPLPGWCLSRLMFECQVERVVFFAKVCWTPYLVRLVTTDGTAVWGGWLLICSGINLQVMKLIINSEKSIFHFDCAYHIISDFTRITKINVSLTRHTYYMLSSC